MAAWMASFAPLFTRPTFANLVVLVTDDLSMITATGQAAVG